MKNDAKEEEIKLYDLKFESRFFREEENKLKDKEKDLSKIDYYKIENKKLKELEKVFKQVKTKIKLKNKLGELSDYENKPETLLESIFDIKRDGKNKNVCIVYDEKNFSNLIEIEFQDLDYVLFVEKLDNNDLILLARNSSYYELLVYRLKPEFKKGKKGYYLSQKIKETLEGFKLKYKSNKSWFTDEEINSKPIGYKVYYIKAISRNRFFCVSNYGFKIYSLNENNEYELILLKPYEKIDFIYEIDTYKFIFGLNLRTVEGYGFCGNAYTCYYNLLLNKIELKNSDKTENKSKQEKFNDFIQLENNKNNKDYSDILRVREKLKLSFISQTMFKYNYSCGLIYDNRISFSDFVVLKNKFFIIMIENNMFVFSLESGQKIISYKINVKYGKMDIKNWDCPENDEFILIVYNNVILFKLKEENSSKISLNVLNYAYFPDLILANKTEFTIKYLKKIKSKKNRFYSYDNEENEIVIY